MNKAHSTHRAGHRQSGIGMLEVLIAVLVVSIGFLGMAALQAKALSTNNSAMARSMATVASYSMLDAMRTDLVSAVAGAYNTASPMAANACPAAGASLSSVQLNQWCNQLGLALGATATTTGAVSCTNLGMCTITITFDDSRAGSAGTTGGTGSQTVRTVTQL